MARIDWIERRLLNWARWLSSGPRIGGGSGAPQDRVDNAGWDAPTVIGTLDGEAMETDQAVASLEADLRQAVMAVYTGSGDRAREARKLGVAVSTLFARVDTAHKCLERWLNDRAAAARAERERVEALRQQQGKPPSIFSSSAAAPPLVPPSQPPRSRLAQWLAELRADREEGKAGSFPP